MTCAIAFRVTFTVTFTGVLNAQMGLNTFKLHLRGFLVTLKWVTLFPVIFRLYFEVTFCGYFLRYIFVVLVLTPSSFTYDTSSSLLCWGYSSEGYYSFEGVGLRLQFRLHLRLHLPLHFTASFSHYNCNTSTPTASTSSIRSILY